MMQKISPAYLAGFLDGEGSISMGKQRAGKNRRKTPHYTCRVTLSNTNRMVMRKIRRTYGGKLRADKHKHMVHDFLTLYFSYEESPKILRAVMPFLVVKRKQAILALKFYENRLRNCKPRNSKTGRFIANRLVAEEEMYWKMRRLNNTAGLDYRAANYQNRDNYERVLPETPARYL